MNNKSSIEINQNKNEMLIDIIDRMSKSEVDFSSTIKSFKEIYTDDFRHSYSVIAKKLHAMDSDERDIVSESMHHLVDGLIKFEKASEYSSDYDSLIKGIIKLNDHINLEIIRIQLDTQADAKLKNAIYQAESLKEDTATLDTNICDLTSEVWDLKDKADSANTQSITILGIFAGIVFVFTGGFSLISTALQNINDASIYKMTFTLSLVGMLIYNLIFLFFYMIAKISNKDISARCLKSGYHCYGWNEEKPCNNCKGIRKLFRKFWYVIVPNMFFIVAMIGTVIIWYIRHL